MKVVTLNCWGLPFLPHTKQRLQRIGVLLSQTSADIILLQEVFRPAHVRLLSQHLSGYQRYYQPGGIFGVGGGLACFSRHPIVHAQFHPFGHAGNWWDRSLVDRLVQKGFVQLTIQAQQTITCVQTHLTANYAHSMQSRYAAILRRQLRELTHTINTIPRHLPVIVAGDFNLMPQHRDFQSFLRGVSAVDMTPGLLPSTQAVARRFRRLLHPTNPQKVDYVLLRHTAPVHATWRYLHDEMQRLSDHFGIMTQIHTLS